MSLYADGIALVDRDAAMGWWWVEVWVGLGSGKRHGCGWESAATAIPGLEEDTFMRADSANRLAQRISRTVGLLVALRLLGALEGRKSSNT